MIKNCEQCNRIFAHPSRSLCEECFADAQKSFGAVKDHLRSNPGATVAEVAQATEVDIETIYEYIREGRLSIIPTDAKLQCSICGGSISAGRVCATCRKELQKGTKDASGFQPKSQTRQSSKVHYMDEVKDRR